MKCSMKRALQRENGRCGTKIKLRHPCEADGDILTKFREKNKSFGYINF
jgi:hypothetical protein